MKKRSIIILLHITFWLGMVIFINKGMPTLGYSCTALVFLSLPLAVIRRISWKPYSLCIGLYIVYLGVIMENSHDERRMVYITLGVIYLISFVVGRLKTWLTLRKMNRNLEEE